MCKLTGRTGEFTIAEIAARASDATLNTVACYVHACKRAGYVTAVGQRRLPNGYRAKTFAVNVTRPDAPFEKPAAEPRLGAAQRQLWIAMRGLGTFTGQELALAASTDEVVVSPAVARKYVAALRRAGYVQALPGQGRRHVRMRLKPSMNTGPNPPVLRGDGSVVDRNRPAGRAVR